MNNRSYVLGLIVVMLFGSAVALAQRSGTLAVGLNRIEGRIMDDTNAGLNDVYVELFDSFNTLVSRQRSTSGGRFSFRGMGPGRYTIRVRPYGTNFLEEERDIEIINMASRSDTVMADFRLRPDSRFRNDGGGVVGTVFAQELPPDARRLYKSAIDDVQAQPEKGRAQLEEAIKIFPKYFDALAALGKSYIISGKYAEGYPYLLRAIDVNAKCSDCYYSLALAFYKLNELAAAVKAIDAAAMLQPQNSVVRLLQGIIFRLSNDFVGSEKALKLAKSLSKEPNAEVHWQLSLVYNRMSRNTEAADELELYLKAKPEINDSQKQNVRDLVAKLRKTK